MQSLNIRIIAVYIISLVGLLVSISCALMYFVVTSEMYTWQNRQEEAAQTTEEIIARSLQDNISQLYYLETIVQATKYRIITPPGKLLATRSSLLEVTILNRSGKVLYSEAQDISILTDPSITTQSTWYKQAIAGNTYLGELQTSEDEYPYLILAIPAIEDDGVIVARLDMQILREIIQDIHIGKNSSAYLINREGFLMAHQDTQIPPTATSFIGRREISSMINAANGNWNGLYRNFQGKLVLGTSHTIRDTDWLLVTELPFFEAFDVSSKAFAGVTFGVTILLLLAILFGIRFLHVMLFSPILDLQEGANRIAEGDLEHPIPITRKDELGKVAQTLNTMSERLKERTRELETQAISLATEIAERKKAERQLQYDAFHDSLTHLANRALLMDRLRISLLRANQRGKSLFAVLFLDFDRFKNINDSLGHAAGDQVLIQAAQRLQECVRGSDTVARLAGDEFVILIEDINNIHDATRFADRLIDELNTPYQLEDREISITFSMGITVSTTGYENAEDILRDADTAMHRAKRNGKARYEIFDPEMREHILEHISLENDLRKAIESHQFTLFYQPVIDLNKNSIHGFEALVRWKHPAKGIIMPDAFIPIAEETGLIVPIGQIILTDATAQLQKWQENFLQAKPLQMSVNLSRRQLTHEGLVEQVEQTLRQCRMDPSHLILEITETAFMHDIETGKNAINRLKALGVEMHLDDFGTGYSSLSQLSHLSFDMVKIDRFFVDQMVRDDKHAGLVRAMISMAHELGMKVIAEGVETIEQMDLLASLGCEYGQGYLFARPQESHYAENMIAQTAKTRPLSVYES